MLLLVAFLLPLLAHPTTETAELALPIQILREKGELTSITYLETEIPNVEESIFPAKLEISATLGRLHGILFYSIDKNDHQLVLEGATYSNKNKLIVQVGQMYYNMILADLCGCSRNCVYETLNLTLETSASTIRIQCNGQPLDVRKYPDKYIFDKDLPWIKFSSKSAKNAAHVWMVNIPPLDGLQSNSRQLDGCLHKVKYRDRDLTLSARGPHFRRGCRDVCTTRSGICNMGHCVGTLNDEPVCDCTAALHIGKNCTDKLNTDSIKTAVFKYQISSLKVSWSSGSSHRILLLQLRDFNITLSSVEDELRLQQKYLTQLGLTSHKRVLLHKYDSHRAHIAILRFLGPNILIQMPLDNDLVYVIPLARNPVHGVVKLTLYSQPGGAADATFKYDDLVYEWTKIPWKFIPLPLLMPKEENSTGSSNISKEKMAGIVLGSIVAVVVVVAVLILIVARKRKRKMLQMLQKLWRRWRRRRRDDPEMLAPLLDGDNEEKMSMLRLRRWLCRRRRRSPVDDGAALWEIVRSLLRQCGEMRTMSNAMVLTDDDPQCRAKIAEIKVELWFILDDIRRVGDLYQDEFVCGHWRSIASILPHLRSSSRSIESDIDSLWKESQRLILAIVNVAITKSRSGPATVVRSAFVSTLTALRSRYDEIKSIKSSLGIAESESLVGDVMRQCSLSLTSLIAGPIRGEAEYERDEFVQRRCREIEERIRKMGGSAECGKEWINHVRSLRRRIQLLMLAIVNVELREGGRNGASVGESTSTLTIQE